MTTAADIRDSVLKRAADDSDFRARLLADPKAAIASETGQTIPDSIKVVVHEDSATTAHLVLPPSPAQSEEELKQVSCGGFWW